MSWLSNAIHHPTSVIEGLIKPSSMAKNGIGPGWSNSAANSLGSGLEQAFKTGFKAVKSKPDKLLHTDHLSNAIWNKLTGQHDPTIVNAFGSPSNTTWEQTAAANPNTDLTRAKDFTKIGDAVAGYFGGSAVSGALSGSGSAAAPSVSEGATPAIADSGSTLAPVTVTAGGGGSLAGDLGAAGAIAGEAPVADGGPTLDPVTVSGSSGGRDLLASLGGAGALSQLGATGGSPSSSVLDPVTVSAGGGSFLPATGSGLGDIGALTPSVMESLGISPGGGTGDGTDSTDTTDQPDDGTHQTPPHDANPSFMSNLMGKVGGEAKDLGGWLSNPKNLSTAGMLGLSLKNAISKPSLPGASQSALNSANAMSGPAGAVIQSGGTSTPIWSQQKASIDATIDQEIQQATQSMQQAAANSGMGNQNSGVVQQQIASIKARAETQRQQMYAQAQQQNVQNAISEMTGSNAVLTNIGNMQMQQQEAAMQAASQTAYLALLLQKQSGGG